MPTGRSILLVARGLDPVGSGGELELTALGLTARGWRVAVATMSTGGSVPERLVARGLTVHRVGARPGVDAAAAARLARLARRVRPNAILGFGRSQLWPVLAARVAAAGSRAMLRLGRLPVGCAQARGLRQLDRVLVTSADLATRCGAAGLEAGRISVVTPVVAPPAPPRLDRNEVARRLGLDPACRWTVAVAPLEPASHLERLVWAMDQLGVVRKDLQHVLVGAGPLFHAIQRRSRAQEVAERLVMLPHCDLLPEVLSQAAVVWQSGEVAVGGCLLDGMARGLPAVAVESEAARQLILPGETGRIVPALPESEFPRRVFGILEDDALASRLGAAAATRAAEAFSAERFVAGLVTALTDSNASG